MKPIQVMIDERLLSRVDRDAEAKKIGRSAFVRRALDDYLRRKRARDTADAYRHEYGTQPTTDHEALGPWKGRAWPDD